MFTVYVLRSKSTSRLYAGSTSDLSRRLAEHDAGLSRSTKNRGPWELVYCEDFPSRPQAVRRERQLKTGRGREELNQLIGISGAP